MSGTKLVHLFSPFSDALRPAYAKKRVIIKLFLSGHASLAAENAPFILVYKAFGVEWSGISLQSSPVQL